MPDPVLEALERFLRRLLARSSLTAEEQRAILSADCVVLRPAAHRDLVIPGAKVDFSLLVAGGLAGRFDQMADGRRQITALHIPGDMCDLHSVPVPIPGWGITALTNSTIVKVPHSHLRRIAERYPAIADAFWRDTIVDGSVLSKWVSNLGRRSGEARLAHMYCEMGTRMELADLGTRERFDLPLRQAQAADVLGLTAVHVNRLLQGLRRQGVVRTDGPTVFVDDLPQLERIADFDPAYLLLKGKLASRPPGT
jgi:CRP-like cAMP-binding protein